MCGGGKEQTIQTQSSWLQICKLNWHCFHGPVIKDACENHPLPARPFSRLLDMILEYLRKTLLESSINDVCWACAECCWDTVSNPGLLIVRLVQWFWLRQFIDWSINGFSHLKNQFEERKQDWLEQKFRLWRLQRLDAIFYQSLLFRCNKRYKHSVRSRVVFLNLRLWKIINHSLLPVVLPANHHKSPLYFWSII